MLSQVFEKLVRNEARKDRKTVEIQLSGFARIHETDCTARQAKRKWFQVILVSACSPAGMHGPNVASEESERLVSLLHLSVFALRLQCSETRLHESPVEAGLSIRTFHSPIPGIPFQALPKPGQRSWPVPSIPHRSVLGPFSTALASRLLLTNGAVTAQRPLPENAIGAHDCSPKLDSPPGFFVPSGSKPNTGSPPQSLPSRFTRLSFAPRHPPDRILRITDHRSRLAMFR